MSPHNLEYLTKDIWTWFICIMAFSCSILSEVDGCVSCAGRLDLKAECAVPSVKLSVKSRTEDLWVSSQVRS